jgi:cyclohexadienyl dehydratase
MRLRHGVVAVAVLLAACTAQQPATEHSLRVCSTGDYRPFTYRDSAGWSGMDIDLARNLAQHMGKQLDLVPTTWAHLVDDMDAKCDLAMGGISVTSERAKRALYSAAYLRDGKAAIIRCADSAKYRDLSDIDRPGVRVVVNPGGSNEQFDHAHLHRATIVTYPDNNTIFGQLTNSEADVMITDASEIRWETTQNRQLCGVSVDHPFTTEEKAYLLPRDSTDLQQRVDHWLDQIRGDGTFTRVTAQWLGQY